MAIFFIVMAGIAAPVTAEVTTIAQGGTVFVGEEGLTFQNGGVAVPAGTLLKWYAPGDTPGYSSPSATYSCQCPGNEVIYLSTFQTRTGNWYVVNGVTAIPIINVQMPAIDVKAFNSVTAEDVTNEWVVKEGTYITFRLDSNLYEAIHYRPNYVTGDATDIKIVVVDEEDTVYTALHNDDTAMTTSPLIQLAPKTSQFYLPSTSNISATLSPNWALGQAEYKAGFYAFYAQVNLNHAKENLGTITGITKSPVYTIAVGEPDSPKIKIEANKPYLTRINDFAVTITGNPYCYCILWVKETSNITTPDTVPYIKPDQQNVFFSGTAAGNNAALYQFHTGQEVQKDVCGNTHPIGAYFAMIILSSSGTRTVGFSTSGTTKNQTYTIRTDYIPYINATMNPAMKYVADKTVNDTVQITVGDPIPEPPAPFKETLTLKKGWNLISTPVITPSIDITGYLYETIYAYNTTTGTYEAVSLFDIEPGEGYWVGAFADADIEFTGEPLTEYQKNISTGWNLIGSLGIATETASINTTPDALSGPLYRYNPEQYRYSQATILKPGQGYWASTAAPCTINVSITPPVAPA